MGVIESASLMPSVYEVARKCDYPFIHLRDYIYFEYPVKY